MSDTVTTQEQAIKLAELFIDVVEEYHALMWQYKMVYELKEITQYPKGWILKYERGGSDGATVDPAFEYISVNKETGETKFGDFSE